MDESNSSNDKGNNGPGNNDNDPTQGNRMKRPSSSTEGHPGSAKANENQNVAEPTGDNSLSDDTWRVEAINNVRTTVSPVRRISFSSTQQTGSCSTIRSLLIGSKRPSSSTEGHPGPAKAPQPGPSSMSRPGPSSMSQPEPSSMSQPGPSSMPQPGPSSMSQPGPSQPASANPMLGAPLHVDVSMQYYRHMDVEEQRPKIVDERDAYGIMKNTAYKLKKTKDNLRKKVILENILNRTRDAVQARERELRERAAREWAQRKIPMTRVEQLKQKILRERKELEQQLEQQLEENELPERKMTRKERDDLDYKLEQAFTIKDILDFIIAGQNQVEKYRLIEFMCGGRNRVRWVRPKNFTFRLPVRAIENDDKSSTSNSEETSDDNNNNDD